MVHQNQDPYCYLVYTHRPNRKHIAIFLFNLGYIAQYIDEMGKKIDKVDEMKDGQVASACCQPMTFNIFLYEENEIQPLVRRGSKALQLQGAKSLLV